MKVKKIKIIPAGIQLLRYFYGLTAILCTLYLVFLSGYTDIIWLNNPLSQSASLLLSLILIFIPLLLYFGLRRLNRLFWCIACAYHIFFVLNNVLGTISLLWVDFPLRPIIKITGKDFAQMPLSNETELILFTVFNLNLFMGIIILWYLWIKRGCFGGNGRKKSIRDEMFG
jgi:hypothetical protein